MNKLTYWSKYKVLLYLSSGASRHLLSQEEKEEQEAKLKRPYWIEYSPVKLNSLP